MMLHLQVYKSHPTERKALKPITQFTCQCYMLRIALITVKHLAEFAKSTLILNRGLLADIKGLTHTEILTTHQAIYT